jgi:hypothetical protein
VIERLSAVLAKDRGYFAGRLAESSTKALQKTREGLLEAGATVEMEARETIGVYEPIAGEIRYASNRIDNITPALLRWDSADYFELAYVKDVSGVKVPERLQHNAFLCTELYLFEFAKSAHFLVRKSGDEDEFEILSTALPFSVVHYALCAIIQESKDLFEVVFKLKDLDQGQRVVKEMD